jgi:hypothetical protein
VPPFAVVRMRLVASGKRWRILFSNAWKKTALRHDLFKTWRADPTRRPVEAMRVYARQANDVEFQNWAAEIRVHAGDERVSCCMR